MTHALTWLELGYIRACADMPDHLQLYSSGFLNPTLQLRRTDVTACKFYISGASCEVGLFINKFTHGAKGQGTKTQCIKQYNLIQPNTTNSEQDVCPAHPDNDSLEEKCLDISPLEASLSSALLSCFQNDFNLDQSIAKIQVSL